MTTGPSPVNGPQVPQPGPHGTQPSRRRAIAEVVGAAVLFGTTGTARAKGPAGIDPVVAGLARLAIGGPLLLASRAWTLRRRGERVAIRELPVRPVLLGAACVALYQLGFFAGLARTGVSVGTILAIGSGPVLAGALAFVFLRERPERRWVVATAIAVTGAALVSISGRGGSTSAVGVVLVLLAGLGYAGFTVLTRTLVVRRLDGPLVLGALFSAGAIAMVPFCVGRSVEWVTTTRGLAVVTWLGIGPTALAYTLFADGLRTLSGPTATTFVLAEPVTAVLLGRFALHERLASGQWVGAVVVLAALALLASQRDPASSVDP